MRAGGSRTEAERPPAPPPTLRGMSFRGVRAPGSPSTDTPRNDGASTSISNPARSARSRLNKWPPFECPLTFSQPNARTISPRQDTRQRNLIRLYRKVRIPGPASARRSSLFNQSAASRSGCLSEISGILPLVCVGSLSKQAGEGRSQSSAEHNGIPGGHVLVAPTKGAVYAVV